MIDVFWGCLIGGMIFSLVSLFGIHGAHHGIHAGHHDFSGAHHGGHSHFAHFLNPLTIVGGITAFGGAGILLTKYTTLSEYPLLAFAIISALLISVAVHTFFVKPLSKAESSIGFSMSDIVGKTARVTIPIPANGYGEVMISIGGGNNCQIATSHDEQEIRSGQRVVIVEVRNHAVIVSPFDELS